VRRNIAAPIIDDPDDTTSSLAPPGISTQRQFNDGSRCVFSTDANNSGLIRLLNLRCHAANARSDIGRR